MFHSYIYSFPEPSDHLLLCFFPPPPPAAAATLIGGDGAAWCAFLRVELAIEDPQKIGALREKQKKVMVGTMNGYMESPPWLKPLLGTAFFNPCDLHTESSKNECNQYCLDCTGNSFCSLCLPYHRDHHVVQIRRSSYHDVIRVSEVSRFIDIAFVQTYVINSHKIVFLNGRPQPRHGKGVTNTCEICGRSILDSFRFCSLGCKLGGINRDPRLSFALRPRDCREMLHGSDSDEWPGTKKLKAHSESSTGVTAVAASPGDSGNSMSPSTPPIATYRTHRRKGMPHRAPF